MKQEVTSVDKGQILVAAYLAELRRCRGVEQRELATQLGVH